jgi:hypothetical protein
MRTGLFGYSAAAPWAAAEKLMPMAAATAVQVISWRNMKEETPVSDGAVQPSGTGPDRAGCAGLSMIGEGVSAILHWKIRDLGGFSQCMPQGLSPGSSLCLRQR